MIFNTDTAERIAENLLQIKAIKLNNSNPFTWASGLKSPIYCDNRIALSYPKIRTYIRQELVKSIAENFGDVDVIAGVATAGIPQGMLVAQEMGLPFIYVRASAKSHGMINKIEGVLHSGQSVLVVEDLVSTGKSSLAAVDAINEAGAKVKGMVSIFTYGLAIAEENFKKKKCKLVSLSDYEHLIKTGIAGNSISEKDQKSLLEWREDPKAWSDKQ
jgi:orotate phosphoribosyltransferase